MCEPQLLRTILSDAIASKRRDHEVKLLGDARLWAVVDALALEQAIGHLIQNAVEASSAEAPITVRVAAAGDEVRITIADHGTGMDGDFVRNRLFQPFASTKPDGFGIGRSKLGLAGRCDGRPPGRRQHPGRGQRVLDLSPSGRAGRATATEIA